MIQYKHLYYLLFGLWQSLALAIDFDSSIIANGQWMLNTNDGNSQGLNLTLRGSCKTLSIPET